MPISPEVHSAITQAAHEYGFDPADWLSIAERESSFNVNGRAPGSSAYGLFQLLKAERAKHGGSSQDPLEQARAYGRYASDLRSEMAGYLGRNPTGEEFYLGHHFGGLRGARLATGLYHPETPVSDIFTRGELAANPHIGRAGTAGTLSSSIMSDIGRRRARWGGSSSPESLERFGGGGDQPESLEQFGGDPGEGLEQFAATQPAQPLAQPAQLPAAPAGAQPMAFGETSRAPAGIGAINAAIQPQPAMQPPVQPITDPTILDRAGSVAPGAPA